MNMGWIACLFLLRELSLVYELLGRRHFLLRLNYTELIPLQINDDGNRRKNLLQIRKTFFDLDKDNRYVIFSTCLIRL